MSKKFAYKPIADAAWRVLIDSIRTAGAKLESDIQLAATEAVRISIVDRNSSRAAQLFDAVRKNTVRRDALRKFLEKFGNLMYAKETGTMAFFDVAKHTDAEPLEWTDEYAQTVLGTPWQDTKPERITSDYDVVEAVDALIKKVASMSKKGASVKHADLAQRIKAVQAKYTAELLDKELHGEPTE